jgi:hypothetical protein
MSRDGLARRGEGALVAGRIRDTGDLFVADAQRLPPWRPTRTRSISPSVAEPGAGLPKATTVAEHEDARTGGKGE